MNLVQNVLGMPANYVGSNAIGFNQYLSPTVDAEPSLECFKWTTNVLTLYTNKIARGIYDHVHYLVNHDGRTPTVQEMGIAAEWRSDLLVLQLPEASGILVHALAHDIYHRPYDENGVTAFGEYWVDLTPPAGSIVLNGGASMAITPIVDLHILASDNISGIDQMYISGDCSGDNVNTWVPYQEHVNITLNTDEGRHTVIVNLVDRAGNYSPIMRASIIHPIVRYYFEKTASNTNFMGESAKTMSVDVVHCMNQRQNQMKESDNHGRLGNN